MKEYPSINNSNGKSFREFKAYVFTKYDGSNLRFEWNRKSGWSKFGTRNRLFDETDDVFGEAIPLFLNTLADQIEKVFKKNNYDLVTIYTEFLGENSFAGQHEKSDKKFLKLFDVAPHKKGILGPKEFLDLYGHLDIAEFLGIHNWTRGFVERVRIGDFEGSSFEGVVGKTGEGHKLFMAKAKTQNWIDKVKLKYGDEADKIIMS